MIVVCLEPEAVECRPRNGATLIAHRPLRGTVVELERGDVEVEGGVDHGLCHGAGR